MFGPTYQRCVGQCLSMPTEQTFRQPRIHRLPTPMHSHHRDQPAPRKPSATAIMRAVPTLLLLLLGTAALMGTAADSPAALRGAVKQQQNNDGGFFQPPSSSPLLVERTGDDE